MEEAERLRRLTTDLLDFARPSTPPLVPVALGPLLIVNAFQHVPDGGLVTLSAEAVDSEVRLRRRAARACRYFDTVTSIERCGQACG